MPCSNQRPIKLAIGFNRNTVHSLSCGAPVSGGGSEYSATPAPDRFILLPSVAPFAEQTKTLQNTANDKCQKIGSDNHRQQRQTCGGNTAFKNKITGPNQHIPRIMQQCRSRQCTGNRGQKHPQPTHYNESISKLNASNEPVIVGSDTFSRSSASPDSCSKKDWS